MVLPDGDTSRERERETERESKRERERKQERERDRESERERERERVLQGLLPMLVWVEVQCLHSGCRILSLFDCLFVCLFVLSMKYKFRNHQSEKKKDN